MDLLVTLANLLNVTGFFVKDRLWVRALSLSAAACIGIYLAARPAPFAYAVYWNIVFLALNAYFLVRLVLDRFRSPAEERACTAERAAGPVR